MKNIELKKALLASSALCEKLDFSTLSNAELVEVLVGAPKSAKWLSSNISSLSSEEVAVVLYRQPQLISHFSIDAVCGISGEWKNRLVRQNPELCDSLARCS